MTVEVTRSEPYTHLVPGTHNGECYEITELHIDGEGIVGVEIHGETFDPCRRCVVGGLYSYDGFSSVCYACHGASHGKATTEADIIRRYIARQKAAAKRAAEAEKAAAEQRAELAAWEALNADLAKALKAHRSPVGEDGYADFGFTPRDKFLTSLADQAAYQPLSEKQTTAASAALVRLAERAAERAERNAERVAAGHWGTVGKRAEVTVTVTGVRFFDNDFGGSFLVSMTTTEGHTLKTWTSSSFVGTAQEAQESGQPIRVKATPKAHGSYNDLPETTVTRVTAL